MNDIPTLLDVRRNLIEVLAHRSDPKLLTALALLTELLHRAGVQSLGDIGRNVWVWGRGAGTIIDVKYLPETTTYTIYAPAKKLTLREITFEEFVYAY